MGDEFPASGNGMRHFTFSERDHLVANLVSEVVLS
jgi:hypothetical protein